MEPDLPHLGPRPPPDPHPWRTVGLFGLAIIVGVLAAFLIHRWLPGLP
jgi:hypothetical protein